MYTRTQSRWMFSSLLLLVALAATNTPAIAGTIAFTNITSGLVAGSTGFLTVNAGVVSVTGSPGTISLTGGSIICGGEVTCTGDYQFSATVTGLTAGDLLSLSADGTITGSIESLGVNALLNSVPLSLTIPVTPGNFNVNVGPVASRLGGSVNLTVDVLFTMAFSSSISLPSSVTFQAGTAAATPEPATSGLMLLGLGAGAALLRRRR